MIEFIPDKRIEDKAYSLLKAFSKNQQWEISFPIPVELIIETELEYMNDLINFNDEGILGSISSKDKIIYTNDQKTDYFNKYPGTYEFTLAHEVGHWVLHLCAEDNQQKLENVLEVIVCRSGSKAPEELQADKFAASLLMPENLVKETVKGRDIYSWTALYNLRDQWKVSITALKYRLEKLGLLYFDEDEGKFYRSKNHAQGQLNLFFT